MPDIYNASRNSRGESAENTESSSAADGSYSTTDAGDSQKESNTKHRHVDDYSQVMRNESAVNNPLAAFWPKPENIFFDTQHHNENVILVLRQHPITQVPWLLVAVGMALLPFLFSFFPFFVFFPPTYQLAALVGWYALVFSFILESFLMWFFNVYIITDERVIDVDFHSLIYKNVSSAKIDNIEDVSATTGGALRSVFNYGTIRIQTAAANNEFEFTDVPQPAKVTALINELLLEEEHEKLEGRVS